MWNRVDYIIKRGAFPVKRACYFTFDYKCRSCIDIHKVENTHHLWHIDKYTTGEQWLTCCISFKNERSTFTKLQSIRCKKNPVFE